MKDQLTVKEYEILIDALDEWEDSCDHNPTDLIGEALGALLGKATPEQQAKLKEKLDRKMAEHEMEHRSRKETSALLKAKLIGLKNSALILEATSQINEPPHVQGPEEGGEEWSTQK